MQTLRTVRVCDLLIPLRVERIINLVGDELVLQATRNLVLLMRHILDAFVRVAKHLPPTLVLVLPLVLEALSLLANLRLLLLFVLVLAHAL